jgi:flagellar protein FliL
MMAKENLPTDPKSQQPAAAPQAAPKQGFTLKKILMIGVPILVVQIGLVYVLVTSFFAPKLASGQQASTTASKVDKNTEDEQSTQIVVIKDVIVNPAGTNGTRFLVTTVGLEVPTVEAKAELEEKEVQTRDVLITILAGKTLAELVTPEDKDSLRVEIERRVNTILRSGKLKSVYISKFIIQ